MSGQSRSAELEERVRELEAQLAVQARELERRAGRDRELQAILERCRELLFRLDRAQRLTYVSPQALDLIGYPPEEIVGEPWPTLATAHPNNTSAFDQAEQAMGSGRPFEHSTLLELRHKDGRAVAVEVDYGPSFGPDGAVDGLIGSARDVTAQRQAASERERLLAAIEAGTDFVSTATPDGRVTYLNRGGRELLGIGLDEDLSALRIRECHPPEAFELLSTEGLAAAIRDGVWRGETALLRRDGTVVPVSQVLMAHEVVDGKPTYLSTVIRDLSSRLETERALRQAGEELEARVAERTEALSAANQELTEQIAERERVEARLELFRRFVEASGEGMGWADLEGHIRYLNPTLGRLLEAASAAEVLGTLVQERYGAGPRAKLEDEILPTVLRDGAWSGELEMTSLRGRALPTLHSLFLLRDAAGQPAMLANVVTDLTERKQAEEELRQHRDRLEELVAQRTAVLRRAIDDLRKENAERTRAERALRTSEERYRLISTNVRDVIWTSDLDFSPTFISPSVTLLTGHSVEEAMAQPLREKLTTASAIRAQEALAREIQVDEQEGPDPGRSAIVEVEMNHQDGSTVWVEMRISFLRDEAQRPIGLLGVSRDITERKRLERHQAALQEELRHSQKMEAIGSLAGGVAHDFNNILTGIIGYAEMMQKQLGPEDPLIEDAKEIQLAADRAATLTNQLLAFSSKQLTTPKVLQLSTEVSRAERMLRRIIGEHIEMSITHPDSPWAVEADPGHLDQILVNLAVNSRDAMPRGGQLVIQIRNVVVGPEQVEPHRDARPGDYVVLAVRDTGCGMDSEVVERIFEPFFTTKARGEGTGLGLSTVYGLVTQSRGFLQVDSEPGQGTTIEVYLPRVDREITAARERPEQALPLGGETILLVEDDDTVRHLAKRILDAHGYTVLEASEGGAACLLSDLHQGAIQLLLTDVVMPRMNGTELYQRLRQNRPQLAVLYMSGYAQDSIVHRGSADEAIEFIPKPFTFDSLSHRVREVLDRTRRAAE